MLEDQPDRAFPHFLGIPLRCTHGSILSRNGVSGNPGAVHFRVRAQEDRGLLIFGGITCETDAFPIGEVRGH
jgi:hypothetical protein